MARTPSTMLALGTEAPSFTLPDAFGQVFSLSDLAKDGPFLVMFICNHCPYVKLIADSLASVADEYAAKGVRFIAINSNDFASYPDDAPAKMREEIEARGYRFPYLIDESQKVAHAYQAACTPDFYLFNSERRLVYRGEWDGARPGNGVPVDGRSMRAAMDQLLANEPIDLEQRPSLGCNIKWKEGNSPAYYG